MDLAVGFAGSKAKRENEKFQYTFVTSLFFQNSSLIIDNKLPVVGTCNNHIQLPSDSAFICFKIQSE